MVIKKKPEGQSTADHPQVAGMPMGMGMPQQMPPGMGMGMPQQMVPQMGMPQQMPPGMGMPQQMPPGMGMPQQMAPGMGMPQQMPPGMGMPQMGMPQQMAPGMGMPQMGMPQMGMPQQMAPQMGMPMGANPMMAMMQMMQMMQMMGGGLGSPMVDPSAAPFGGQGQSDGDRGLDAEIIRPALITDRIKTQQGVPLGSVLDLLCLTEDGKHALGGVPRGCTIALAGPPGKGKTRSALAGMARVALTGQKVAFVVAEEGFHDDAGSGRDDLCSRMTKIGMAATGLSEAELEKQVLANVLVLESQYHKSHTWDDFIAKYRYLVERENIQFVVIDSLNMLDPTKNRTADNLSALKTYNHEKGVTCVCIGQIRDTGMPVGGEALMHTADVVFLIEEMSLGSKEQAEMWGGKYREKIDVITAVKSVTTPIFPYPIRVTRDPATGTMRPHQGQPAEYQPLTPRE
jgi:KaiC/GvpD/RAD55 family RecA-like ATPase